MLVKDYYGYAITLSASKMVQLLKNVKLHELNLQKDAVHTAFIRSDGSEAEKPIRIRISTMPYTYNSPFTFGVMASLYLFLRRRRRAYSEAVLLLICSHFILVLSIEARVLTEDLSAIESDGVHRIIRFMCKYFSIFMTQMVSRFEPFLLGSYLFIRFRK
jgi:hypothetical protein